MELHPFDKGPRIQHQIAVNWDPPAQSQLKAPASYLLPRWEGIPPHLSANRFDLITVLVWIH